MRRVLVANVAHELRTPLTNIRSFAETLADSPDLSPDTERNFLHVILSESDRMAHIVQDLLTLSRLDSGRSELHLEEFSFDGASRDLPAVLMEAQRHSIPGAGAWSPTAAVTGDRERIMQ
jgi:two-component system sensor histidine kinase VicK